VINVATIMTALIIHAAWTLGGGISSPSRLARGEPQSAPTATAEASRTLYQPISRFAVI